MKSLRWTILASIMLPVLLILAILMAAISSLVISESNRNIDGHLTREALELQLLAESSTDPATGLEIDDPNSLLQLYISRTIPDPNETMFVMSNGIPFARTTDSPPVRLDRDIDFLNLVDSLEEAKFGNWPTEVGNARYLVVPVRAESDTGALVAVIFSDLESAPIQDLLLRFALIAVASLIGMTAISYLVAGRIFKPIGQLTKLVEGIEEGSLKMRIPVDRVRNEIDLLALEFNEMLERLQDSFDNQQRFIDVAGHELRTPLTIILGHLDLIKFNPQERDSSMAIVEDELQRMSRLVLDLQTLTKVSQPEFLKIEEVDLGAFTLDLQKKITTLTERPIEVTSTGGVARFDRERMAQALLQLVENALKYTDAKDAIKVSTTNLGGTLELIVEDSGPGVDLEIQETVFNPFVRGSQTQNIQGAGIGLSVVASIARAHGGNVSVSSSGLGGAKFVIKLPE